MDKEREILKFTPAECRDIWGGNPEFEIIKDEQYDSGRWASYHTLSVKRNSDGKCFESCYSRGLTENQWQDPLDEDDCEFS